MPALDKIAWEILNATSDDWEDLEQIYQSVCFDCSREKHDAYYLRPVKGAPMLRKSQTESSG